MPSPGETPLIMYALMVRRRWLLVLFTMTLMVGPALAVSLLEAPTYRASAQILLARQELDENFNPTATVLTDTQINNEIAYITSDDVSQKAHSLGAVADARASGSAGSNVVTIIADGSDPRQAAASVQGYLDAYAEIRSGLRRATLDKAAAQLQQDVGELQGRIDDLEVRNADQRVALEQRLTSLQIRLGQVETQQQLTSAGLTVLHSPVAADSPVSPTPVRNALLAAVLGLALGISVAVLLESVRQRPTHGDHEMDAAGLRTTQLPPTSNQYARAGSVAAHGDGSYNYPNGSTTSRVE